MNGEMNEAPTLAAKIAWAAEKQSVTFTIVPSSESTLQVLSPSIVRGTLITTFLAIFEQKIELKEQCKGVHS